jgi:hypothetical protein
MTEPTRAKWRRLSTNTERVAELEEDARLVKRDITLAIGTAIAVWVLSFGAGLGLIGWSLHTTDGDWGRIAFWGGLVLGYGGMTITFACLFNKGKDAGWW